MAERGGFEPQLIARFYWVKPIRTLKNTLNFLSFIVKTCQR